MASRWDAVCVSFGDPVVSPAGAGSTTGYRLRSLRDQDGPAASEHHFVGVNKMVPAGHPQEGAGIHLKSGSLNNQAREFESRIAENIVEILETA